jgi:hypothetical protein
MSDAENTVKDEIISPVGRTHEDVKRRNKWARIRQDSLHEWACLQEQGNVMEKGEDDLIRIRFGAQPTAAVRRRWATCTREELAQWLQANNEEPLVGISPQARRFLKASDVAAVHIDGNKIAVYVGTPPDFVQGPYDPGSAESPWTQNLIAVWMGEGEPDCEPEGL